MQVEYFYLLNIKGLPWEEGGEQTIKVGGGAIQDGEIQEAMGLGKAVGDPIRAIGDHHLIKGAGEGQVDGEDLRGLTKVDGDLIRVGGAQIKAVGEGQTKEAGDLTKVLTKEDGEDQIKVVGDPIKVDGVDRIKEEDGEEMDGDLCLLLLVIQ